VLVTLDYKEKYWGFLLLFFVTIIQPIKAK
jgi:hypothetical protein